MPKIMLVEDDNNLREIYGERLMAEGYDIVSASDGEEALTLAINEKPDLIISDVMMPKISGFDMLDILRQTAGTKDTKVIMMTALSQTEDKDRADRLGADKYLVKSQVTLEDVARVVHDLVYGTEFNDPTETANQPQAETDVTQTSSVTTQLNEVEPEPPQNFATSVTTPSESNQTVFMPPLNDNPVAPAPVQVPQPIAQPSAMFTPPTQPVLSEPTSTPPIQAQPIEPVAATSVTTPSEPNQTTEPESFSIISSKSADDPAANPTTNAIPEPLVNPISGEQTNEATAFEVPTVISSADAQSADDELEAISKQLENFTGEETSEPNQHQEPLVEPTEQDLIRAQNGSEEPAVLLSEKTTNASSQQDNNTQSSDPSIPPIVSNPDDNSLEPAGVRKKVIAPLKDSAGGVAPSIYELYEKEMAEEAANAPVVNPGAGNAIAASVDNNPITNSDEANTPTALETIDASQIEGVTVDAEQSPKQPIQQEQAASTTQQTANETPTPNPTDPNSIAL